MSSRTIAGFLALLATLGVGVFAAPGQSGLLWAVIGALTVGAIVAGAHHHAPLSRAPWWLLAGAIAMMATGDTLYGADPEGHGTASVLADVCYFGMFPLIAAGLFLMTRSSVLLADRSRMLDLLTFACAATLAAWTMLISPALTSVGLTNLDRSMLAAYTLGDLLVLIATVRLAVAARRGWAVTLLAGGSAALLAADVGYAMARLDGGGLPPGSPAELGYLLLYAGWGAAALHPSMVGLTEPVDTAPTRLPRRRAALLTISLAVPAALLLIQSATAQLRDAALIAMASLVMLFLVMTRLTDAIDRHRRALLRERALRKAGATLVSAADAEQVRAAVRAAVGGLVPPGQPYEVAIVVDDGRLPVVAADRRTRLIDTALLAAALPAGVREFEAALVCPLSVSGRTVGHDPENDPDPEPGSADGPEPGSADGPEPGSADGPADAPHPEPGSADGPAGRPTGHPTADPASEATAALVVAGFRPTLLTTRDAVEVLAAQAAQALDRVALTEAMNRRQSDEYLRTVVRHSTDVVLIVDDDDQIRYASPSLANVLGGDLPLRPTLAGLVDPGDLDQLNHTLEQARRSHDPDGVRDIWTLRRCDGSRVTVEVTYRDLRADRMVRGFVVTMHDVTHRRRIQRELLRQAIEASPGGRNRQSSSRRFG